MTISDEVKKEMNAYQKGPFKDLTVQDALTIIVVCAAQMDPDDCERDVRRIESIFENCPEFDEKRKEIFSRINTYVNSMQAMDPQQAVEIAANVLRHPELRKSAFELAAEAALPDGVITDEKREILDNISARLYLDDEFVQHSIEKITK
jgi:tellurite resistance protein